MIRFTNRVMGIFLSLRIRYNVGIKSSDIFGEYTLSPPYGICFEFHRLRLHVFKEPRDRLNLILNRLADMTQAKCRSHVIEPGYCAGDLQYPVIVASSGCMLLPLFEECGGIVVRLHSLYRTLSGRQNPFHHVGFRFAGSDIHFNRTYSAGIEPETELMLPAAEFRQMMAYRRVFTYASGRLASIAAAWTNRIRQAVKRELVIPSNPFSCSNKISSLRIAVV
jgi:hypothetical protein